MSVRKQCRLHSRAIPGARIVQWSPEQGGPQVDAFLQRPAFDPAAESAATALLAEIRARGESAIVAAARLFDGARLTAATLRVTAAEQDEALRDVAPAIRRAVGEACRRVTKFARAGLRRDWRMPVRWGSSSCRWIAWACMFPGALRRWLPPRS